MKKIVFVRFNRKFQNWEFKVERNSIWESFESKERNFDKVFLENLLKERQIKYDLILISPPTPPEY